MLILARKLGEQIRIGDQITLTIVKSQGKTVRIGIDAPKDVRVIRAELPPLDSSSNETRKTSVKRTETRSHRSTGTRMPKVVTDRRQSPPSQDKPTARSTARHPDRWSVATMRKRTESPKPGSANKGASQVGSV